MHGVHGIHGQHVARRVVEEYKLGQEKLIHMPKTEEQHVVACLLSNRAVVPEHARPVILIFILHSIINRNKYVYTYSLIYIPIFKYFELNLVNCAWDSWETWTSCTVTCGGGVKVRTRTIDTHEENGGTACSGYASELESCNTGACCIR